MKLKDSIVVVTGAAGGIGRALAQAAAGAGAAHVIVSDRDEAGAPAVAEGIGGTAIAADMSREGDIETLIARTEADIKPIDIFFANAGILTHGGAELPDAEWDRMWRVNVMAHVWMARHLVPRMTARGAGHIVITASAAGLLSQIGSAPYSVTKHAAVGFAEWLALTHGDDGIGVTALCPQAVDTAMISGTEDGVASQDGLLAPEAVAAACIEGVENGAFLVLPHPEVRDYMQRKADDTDRWIGGMRKLNRIYNAPKDRRD